MFAVGRASLNTAYAIIEPMRQLVIKAPSGGIPGRRGSLLGSASCTVQVLSTTSAMMSTSTVSLTVLNWSSSAVCTKGDRHGVAANIHGRWIIVAEDCTDKGSTLPPKGGGTVLRPAGDPINYKIQSITSFGTFHEVRYSGAGVGGGFGGA